MNDTSSGSGIAWIGEKKTNEKEFYFVIINGYITMCEDEESLNDEISKAFGDTGEDLAEKLPEQDGESGDSSRDGIYIIKGYQVVPKVKFEIEEE